MYILRIKSCTRFRHMNNRRGEEASRPNAPPDSLSLCDYMFGPGAVATRTMLLCEGVLKMAATP